jgi:hypothetical protein
LDGCITQGDTAGNPKSVYTTTNSSKYGDNATAMSNMDLVGHIVHSEGYTKEFDLGSTGNIFASSVGGTISTYKCSYNYPGTANANIRYLFVGGTVRNDYGGLGSIFSNTSIGSKYSTIGFRPVVVI